MSFNQILSLIDKFVLNRRLSSCQQVSDTLCPYALGVNNNGFICTSAEILQGNAACAQWIDFMQFYDASHMNYWLGELAKAPTTMSLMDFFADKTLYCQEHVLPFARYVPHPENVVIRQGTATEVCMEFNMQTVRDLTLYLYTIITLGIFLNDQMADTVFMLQNPQEYIGARTFGGEIDFLLGGYNKSAFVPQFGSDQGTYSSMPVYNALQGELSPKQFNELMANERQRLNNTTYLGNETETVLAMKEALQLPESYTSYLEKHGSIPQQKVSPQVFYSIVTGSSSRKASAFSRQSRQETSMTSMKKSTGSDPEIPFNGVAYDEWLSSKRKQTLPFGSTETMNLYTHSGGASSSSAEVAVSDPNNNACVIC